jgi:hypothetical protein
MLYILSQQELTERNAKMPSPIQISNPIHVGQIDIAGRIASSVDTVTVPVYYWSAKRGDKTMVSRLGLSGKDLQRFAGLRVNSVGRLSALCYVGVCYYEVSLCRAELMAE